MSFILNPIDSAFGLSRQRVIIHYQWLNELKYFKTSEQRKFWIHETSSKIIS